MGRHADPDDSAFRRGLLRAIAGATVALLVVAVVTGAFFLLGRDDGQRLASGGDAADEETDRGAPPPGSASQEPDDQEPNDQEQSDASEPGQDGTSESSAIAEAPPPQDTTVQVLDGVGSGTQAEDAAAALEDLGYDVVVVNPAGLEYNSTRVLATEGHDTDGEALIERDDRFGALDRNRTLSAEIDLHVIVGADWQD